MGWPALSCFSRLRACHSHCFKNYLTFWMCGFEGAISGGEAEVLVDGYGWPTNFEGPLWVHAFRTLHNWYGVVGEWYFLRRVASWGLDYDEFNITRLMPFVTTHSICLNSCSCSSFFLCLSWLLMRGIVRGGPTAGEPIDLPHIL